MVKTDHLLAAIQLTKTNETLPKICTHDQGYRFCEVWVQVTQCDTWQSLGMMTCWGWTRLVVMGVDIVQLVLNVIRINSETENLLTKGCRHHHEVVVMSKQVTSVELAEMGIWCMRACTSELGNYWIWEFKAGMWDFVKTWISELLNSNFIFLM